MSLILDLLSAFDLLDRLGGLLGNLRRRGRRRQRGGHRLVILRRYGWTGAQVEGLLRRYHVAVYGRLVDSERLSFDVGRAQARWAEYILQRAGVPLDGRPVDPHNAARAARRPGLPPAWSDRPR